MDKINKRNDSGIKDSEHCYLTIKGASYEQWYDLPSDKAYDRKTAMEALRVEQGKFPHEQFIVRFVDRSFYRIYIKVK